MLGENHSIHHEFPEHHELIDKLMNEDIHFKKLADEYNQLDNDIRSIEINNAPIEDLTFEQMKKKRIQLKDEVYIILHEKSGG
jgi:uncharacterized protein YdcH (DUF465 family)